MRPRCVGRSDGELSPRRAHGLLLLLIFVIPWLLAGCTTAWISAWLRDKERQEALAPVKKTESQAALPVLAAVTIRVRVYVDADFRRLFLDWEREVRRECDAANSWLEPFGAQFEIVKVVSWEHPHVEDLVAALAALREADSGAQVDWVLGMVGALPVYTDDMNTLGRAYAPGVHAVIRALDDGVELEWMKRGLPMTSSADVERLYSARRRHKNAIQWIHEWAHGVGATHVAGRPDSIMAAVYDPQMSQLDWANEELVRVAREFRYGANGDLGVWAARAAEVLRRMETLEPDQRDVLTALETIYGARPPAESAKPTGNGGGTDGGTPGPKGDAGAGAAQAITKAPPAGTSLAVADSPWTGIEGQDMQQLQRVIEIWRKGDATAAWLELVPLRSRHRDHLALRVSSCELAFAAQRADSSDVCTVAKLVAPRDPRPPATLVRVALTRKERPDSALLQAMCEADMFTAAPGDAQVVGLTELATGQGALSCAERLLGLIQDPPTREKSTARLRQRRNLWGLSPGGSGNAPQEVALVQRIQAVDDDLRRGKTDVAVASARALVAEQPGSATWALLGEATARQRRYPEARRLCVQALEAYEANARAHYVLAVLDLHEARTAEAHTYLRRAVSEAPDHGPAWELLAKVLKNERRQSELEELRKEYQASLGSAAPF